MPGHKAVAQGAFHDLSWQGVDLELGKDGLDSKLPCDRQQQHQQDQPENAALESGTVFSQRKKNQQIRREGHAQPTQVGKHLTRNPPCQRPVIQDAKQGGGSEIADGPKGTDPQRYENRVKMFSKAMHLTGFQT